MEIDKHILPSNQNDKYMPKRNKLLRSIQSRDRDGYVLFQSGTLFREGYIACSFDPQQWHREEVEEGKALEGLQFICQEMDIKDIRLGMRWNKIQKEDGSLSLDYYKPYIQYCYKNNISMCLNIGPIKVMRHPEDHVPHNVVNKLSKPMKHKKIFIGDENLLNSENHEKNTTSRFLKHLKVIKKFYFTKIFPFFRDYELAEYSLPYFESLLRLMKTDLPDTKLIYALQPENEAFARMGPNKIKMSKRYTLECVDLIHKYYPDKQILLNSAGRFNFREIINVIKRFNKKHPESKELKQKKQTKQIKQKFIVGLDYYYKTPITEKYKILQKLDAIALSLPWDITYKGLQRRAKQHHFEIEVTEGQFEPWGDIKGPGDTLKDLNFLIERMYSTILKYKPSDTFTTPSQLTDQNTSPSSTPNNASLTERFPTPHLRLWGVERFYKKYIDGDNIEERERMIEMIKKTNTK